MVFVDEEQAQPTSTAIQPTHMNKQFGPKTTLKRQLASHCITVSIHIAYYLVCIFAILVLLATFASLLYLIINGVFVFFAAREIGTKRPDEPQFRFAQQRAQDFVSGVGRTNTTR